LESLFLTISVVLVAMLAIKLLWRPGEPPTLLLLIALHLVQVSTALLYADVLGVHVNSISEYRVDLEAATWVALGAVLCLAFGMSSGNAGPSIWQPTLVQAEARKWSPKIAFVFFLVTFALELLFKELSTISEGVRQILLAGSNIQWIGVFLLTYVCLSQNRGFGYLFAAVGLELVVGFLGFFGGFRDVFFVLFVAVASARPRLQMRSIIPLIVAAAVALVLASFWSEVKTGYRAFLNRGTYAQVVLVPVEERLSYIAARAAAADADTLAKGFEKLVLRMGYVEFFGATLENVPARKPYENGAMTLAAISHIFLPRLFFPDKAALPPDTQITTEYTGLPLMYRNDTSISIGYPGELYVDFGVTGLFICMAILGFAYGKATRIIQRSFKSPLIGYGATIPLLMPGFLFETSLPKLLGGVATSFIFLLLMSKFIMPYFEKMFSLNRAIEPIAGHAADGESNFVSRISEYRR
jgi:hypothetical protein